MADYAAELGFTKFAEARDAGRLDTRQIHKLKYKETVRQGEEGEELVYREVDLELHNQMKATETILKVAGDLEETITIRYEQGLDDFFTSILGEFDREGDDAILERFQAGHRRLSSSPRWGGSSG